MDEPRFFYSDVEHLHTRLTELRHSLDFMARNARFQAMLEQCEPISGNVRDDYWTGIARASDVAASEVNLLLALINVALRQN